MFAGASKETMNQGSGVNGNSQTNGVASGSGTPATGAAKISVQGPGQASTISGGGPTAASGSLPAGTSYSGGSQLCCKNALKADSSMH